MNAEDRLLIDIGNSHLKWLYQSELPDAAARTYSHRKQFPDVFNEIFNDGRRPSSILIASVAGETCNEIISDWFESQWQFAPGFAKSRSSFGDIINAYDEPERLGVDRWLALIAAQDLFSGEDLVVVDAGTATTLDVLQANGRHLGGQIIPGIETMKSVLLKNTAIVSREFTETTDGWGRSTEACITIGALDATIGMIERAMDKMVHEDMTPRLILTGGKASGLANALDFRFHREPNLVLQGLSLIASETIKE